MILLIYMSMHLILMHARTPSNALMVCGEQPQYLIMDTTYTIHLDKQPVYTRPTLHERVFTSRCCLRTIIVRRRRGGRRDLGALLSSRVLVLLEVD
jgi:hypothetical protein